MPIRKAILLAVAVLAGLVAALLWLLQQEYSPQRVPPVPAYSRENAVGDPIMAVFEGRIPCSVPDCQTMKVQLVLYQHPVSKAPTTYWLGRILVGKGNDRIVSQGSWSIGSGVKGYPEATLYELDANADAALRLYWRVNDEILLPVDEERAPKAGNAGWGYMLSRNAAPYGPPG